MENMTDLNLSEMKLLNYLGKCPELTNRELAQSLDLKNPPYISTLKRRLEKKQYFFGPYYQTDYGKIFKNRVRKAIAIILFEHSYETMLSLLKSITCFSYIYPIEERFFRSYLVSIFDSDTEAVKTIFDYLKQKGIIFHYELYCQEYHTYVIPPTFLINDEEASFVPPLTTLMEKTRIPDLSFGTFEGIPLSQLEQDIISYFEQGICVLTQIMNEEKARGNFHTYAEWKTALKQLTARPIIRPVYDVYPLPYERCSHSFLFVRASTLEDTKTILFNFGKKSRLYKKIFLWTSYQTGSIYGVIYCISHPEFSIRLLGQLDAYKEIEDKKFFVVRKNFSLWEGQSIPMNHYNPEAGTLYYPYDVHLKKIKTLVEDSVW